MVEKFIGEILSLSRCTFITQKELLNLYKNDSSKFFKVCVYLNSEHLIGFFSFSFNSIDKEPEEIYDNKYITEEDKLQLIDIINKEILLYKLIIDRIELWDCDAKKVFQKTRLDYPNYDKNKKIKQIEVSGDCKDILNWFKIIDKLPETNNIVMRLKKYYGLEFRLYLKIAEKDVL